MMFDNKLEKDLQQTTEQANSNTTTESGLQTPIKEQTIQEQVISLVTFIVIVLAIVLPIRMFVVKPFLVEGTSMYPEYNTWHYLIVDRLTYHFNKPERGDVITFRYPKNPKRHFLKRIIALPSETIELNGYRVTIKNKDNPNGFVLDEPYILEEKRKNDRMTITLGDDEYFVMGDNRKESSDSRYWGTLDESRIVGRVLLRLFPFSKIGIFPGKAEYKTEK